MVKSLITSSVLLCACFVLAQRVTHRDPRYLAELSSGAQSFEPPRQLELERWLTLDYGLVTSDTATGTEVQFWTNFGTFPASGGLGKDWGQGTGTAVTTNKPLLKTNILGGREVIQFGPVLSGRGNFIQFNNANNSPQGNWTNAELFIVSRAFADPPGTFTSNTLYHVSPVAVGAQVWPNSDGLIYESFGTSVRKNGVSKTNDLRNWSIYHIVTRTNLYIINVNGQTIFTSTNNITLWSPNALYLGLSNPALNEAFFSGQIAELLQWGDCSPPLTSDEQRQAYSYLTNRFGVTNFVGFTMP